MGPGCPITAGMHTIDTEARDALGSLSGPVRDWFAGAFPEGPTPAQRLAWPPIAAGEHMLLVSPTGTGKTLAGFLAILDRLFRRHAEGTLVTGPALRLCLSAAESGLRHRAQPGDSACGDRAAAGVRREPRPCRRADGRYLGLFPPQAPGPAAAHLDHDAGESLALAQPGKLGRSLARGRAHHRGRGARACAHQARGRPGGLARAALSPGESRSLPGRSVGHLPACRARGAVPGGTDANLPRGRSTPAPRHAAHGDRGRGAAGGWRGSASRPDVSQADPAAAPGDESQPDDGHLRQHPAVHREDHSRPEARPETSGCVRGR